MILKRSRTDATPRPRFQNRNLGHPTCSLCFARPGHPAGFGDAATVAVVVVSGAARSVGELAFGVPEHVVNGVLGAVAGGIVQETCEVIVPVDSLREAALLGAAGVSRVGGCSDGLKVSPGIEAIDFAPEV